MRVLGYTTPARVFEVVDALNNLGAFAVAPRKVELVRLPKQRHPSVVETTAIGGYFFAVLTDQQWHQCRADRIAFSTVQLICNGEWAAVQAYLQRVEQDYQTRMEQFEAGKRVLEYQQGDALQLLGGLFKDHLATFQDLDESGRVPMIKAKLVGTELFGKPVEVLVDPIMASKVLSV